MTKGGPCEKEELAGFTIRPPLLYRSSLQPLPRSSLRQLGPRVGTGVTYGGGGRRGVEAGVDGGPFVVLLVAAASPTVALPPPFLGLVLGGLPLPHPPESGY